jgi:hypothetical protein
MTHVTATIRIHHLRANRSEHIEFLATDLPAIYGARLDRLVQGKPVVCGGMIHRVVRVSE